MKIIAFLILIALAAGGYLYLHPEVIRQVSDTPPTGGIKYEVLHYRGDVNVVPALPKK